MHPLQVCERLCFGAAPSAVVSSVPRPPLPLLPPPPPSSCSSSFSSSWCDFHRAFLDSDLLELVPDSWPIFDLLQSYPRSCLRKMRPFDTDLPSIVPGENHASAASPVLSSALSLHLHAHFCSLSLSTTPAFRSVSSFIIRVRLSPPPRSTTTTHLPATQSV